MTLENWNDLIVVTFRSNVNKFLSAIYLISWIFIGNFVYLNLFLAILIDAFTKSLEDDSLKNEINVDEDKRYFEQV